MGNLFISWLKYFVSFLSLLSCNLIKTLQVYAHVECTSFPVLSSQQWKAILIIETKKFCVKYRFVLSSNSSYARSADIIFFFVSILRISVFDRKILLSFLYHHLSDDTHLCYSLTFTSSRRSDTLQTLASKPLPLIDWERSCISVMFRLLYWSASFSLISLFIKTFSNKFNRFSGWPARFSSVEFSFLSFWMRSFLLFSDVAESESLSLATVISFPTDL